MGIKDLRQRALGIYHQFRIRSIEHEHLLAFQKFYEELADHGNVFYMFFTSGLLHWARKSLEFVPPDVNLVLLGSDLEQDEEAWVRRNISRPFHHLRLPTDDKTVWEFLFETSRHNFGWLDIDCFVFNSDLFYRMIDISPDVAIHCTWTYAGPGGRDILLTYFSFLNAEVVRAVNRQVRVSPTTYSYEESRHGRSAPHAFPRIPSTRQVELLRQVLPQGKAGRPVYVTEPSFYDTLQLYQLTANALGYHLRKIGPAQPEDIFHVGKVSYYRKWKKFTQPARQRVYRLLLQADYLLLSELGDELPAKYAARRDEIAAELEETGLSTNRDRIERSLREGMALIGANEKVVSRILYGA